jgi:hypothetical protein
MQPHSQQIRITAIAVLLAIKQNCQSVQWCVTLNKTCPCRTNTEKSKHALIKFQNIHSKSDDTYHNKLTQLKNLWEFWTHGILQMFCFCLCHLTTREVKHLLTKKFEDSHIVLAKAFICLAGSNNIRNKWFPVLGPFTF